MEETQHCVIEADFALNGVGIVTEEIYKHWKWKNKVIFKGNFDASYAHKKHFLKTRPAPAEVAK
jgi:hypothetical protein